MKNSITREFLLLRIEEYLAKGGVIKDLGKEGVTEKRITAQPKAKDSAPFRITRIPWSNTRPNWLGKDCTDRIDHRFYLFSCGNT